MGKGLEDLRVLKTLKSLRAAVLELASQNPIDKISVVDICEVAIINRMTFYKYYKDKFELFRDAIESAKKEIGDKITVKFDGTKQTAIKMAINCLDAIYEYYCEHNDVIAGVSRYNGSMLSNAIASNAMELLSRAFDLKEGNLSSKYPSDVIAACVYGGFIGFVEYCLNNPSEYDPQSIRIYLTRLEKDIIFRNYTVAEE
jgi:AcrR family transcriptional regulator